MFGVSTSLQPHRLSAGGSARNEQRRSKEQAESSGGEEGEWVAMRRARGGRRAVGAELRPAVVVEK